MDSYKLLMMNQGKAYGAKAAEEEIESIDYNRDSVRSILKGYAPKDDEETRIFGIKKALISLLIKIISLQKKISTSYI